MNHFVHCCSFSTSNKITSKGCQSASQTCDYDAKNAKFFCGGGTAPCPDPSPVKRETPSPHTQPPRRFRRLDLNPSHSEILPTLPHDWSRPVDGCDPVELHTAAEPCITSIHRCIKNNHSYSKQTKLVVHVKRHCQIDKTQKTAK